EVRRGRIGVAVQDLTPDLADALNLTDSSGAVVGSVEDGSPAASAGLQAGDVIVSVDRHPISGSADLRNRIGLTPVGSDVAVEYLRDGARKRLTIRVAPENAALSAP
ncbi:PDZ domain-containing protein, partial [Mesorhizobium sp. M2E.F.Ca.ET.154.01.1.1]|uniref:PDZ domain-containing protein n=1 Tax=Mesorhizobium sp. M2E.F.Ca.ET.154.01.1.1 TaxID=2500521 RepID=UPI00109251FC